jgi:hypothetical protein
MTTPDYTARDAEAVEDRAEAATNWLRGYIQIRGIFVQNPDPSSDRKGLLAKFVTERQHRALLLYLMLLSVWPWLQRKQIPLEAHVWMNLLHSRIVPGESLVWSESTLSRTWKYLADIGLVEKRRGKRGRLFVAPRLENTRGPYTFPTGEKKKLDEAYFTLPDRFWLEEDFAKLSLPGLAVLLILAKETNKPAEYRITQEQMAEWYGFSRSTVAKGLQDLRDHALLEERIEWIPAPLSKARTTTATHYSLTGDYSHAERLKLRLNAERRRCRVAAAPSSVGAIGAVAFASGEGGELDDE